VTFLTCVNDTKGVLRYYGTGTSISISISSILTIKLIKKIDSTIRLS